MDVLTPPTFFRATSYLGAASEHFVIAKLLLSGHRVAVPVVDDDGVDLVVDYKVTVQVKSSAFINVKGSHKFHVFKSPRQRWAADFFVFHGRKPEEEDSWWIFPRSVLLEERIEESICLRPGGAGRSERFNQYLDAWHLFEDPDV